MSVARQSVASPASSAGPESRSVSAAALSAVLATVGAAALCWVVAVQRMQGMDMGVATTLGSLSFFLAAWVSMMAAMMLPGALPAAFRRARGSGHALTAPPLFAASYLAVWTLVGLLVYALYQPHGARIAGVLTIAAGIYELTPLKRGCRRRCRDERSGIGFGLNCLGSSGGLMLLFLAVGAMSITWMSVIAALVLTQKLLPPRPLIDVPLAAAIVGLGIAILVTPSSIPGLMPAM